MVDHPDVFLLNDIARESIRRFGLFHSARLLKGPYSLVSRNASFSQTPIGQLKWAKKSGGVSSGKCETRPMVITIRPTIRAAVLLISC